MSVIWMLFRRMLSQPGLTATLLLGMSLACAVSSGVVIYSGGSLQRLLEAELVAPPPPSDRPETHRTPLSPPGSFYVLANRREFTTPAQVDRMTEELSKHLPAALQAPVSVVRLSAATWPGRIWPDGEAGAQEGKPQYAALGFRRDLASHATVVEGALPRAADPQRDGSLLLEALVNDAFVEQYRFGVGDTLLVAASDESRMFRVRIAGLFRPADAASPYWYDPEPTALPEPGLTYNARALAGVLLLPEADFWKYVAEQKGGARYDWHYRFDAPSLQAAKASPIALELLRLERRIPLLLGGAEVKVSPLRNIGLFLDKAADLRLPLLMLSLPMMGLLGYFLWLTANLAAARRANEMALLNSRGGSPVQILGAFAMEGLILAAVAAAAGPLLGAALARLIGAAAGFLQFAGRQPLPVSITAEAYVYAAATALAGFSALMPPAVAAARRTMVGYKQEAARDVRPPLWQTLWLDLILLGAVAYGWHWLRTLHAAAGGALPLSPALLAVPFAGIYAAGLVALRLFPAAAGLAGRIASTGRGITLSLTMQNIARQPSQHRPLVMLMTLTVGLGTYSALAARSTDRALEDRIRFQIGTELRLQQQWKHVSGSESPSPPPYYFQREIPGVRATARVLQGPVKLAAEGRTVTEGHLVAIEPEEFAQVAWFRRDLAPYPLGEYLLALARNPDGAIVSSRFLRDLGLAPGTEIELAPSWYRSREGEALPKFRILAGVGYWPGLDDPGRPFFIVNLDLIRRRFGVQPYEVWATLEPEASPAGMIRDLSANGVTVTRATYAEAHLFRERSSPQHTGLNGLLSLGFLTAVGVTLASLFLHTQTSLQSRLPHFGVMRAMGLTVSQLLRVVTLEVGTVALGGALVGTAAGVAAGRIFLPILERAGAIPFLVLGQRADLVRLHTLLALAVLAALVWVGAQVALLRLHVAIKLGEEQ